MSTSLALRQARRLSTAAAAATTAITTPSGISVSKAKYKLRSEHDPDKALKIYSSVSNHYSSPLSSRYTQDLTVKRLAKARRFSDIETLIEAHKSDPKITQEPYLSTLIRSYGVAGMFDHALKTYNQMDELGTKRSVISFNALLSACTQSKIFDQVPKLFDEMPKRHGFSPDKFSYGILIKSYCQSGSLQLAIETMKEMDNKGVEITAVTYTTLLSGLYKRGMSDEAERVWDAMVEKGCGPDVAVYNVRLMGIASPKDAIGLIEDMKKAGLVPDTISYNYLMTCYCKYGMMQEAYKVYDELEVNGCKPNAATYRTLVFHFCRYGDFSKGFEVFKKSVEVHKIPDFNTLQHLVRGLVMKKNMKDARLVCRTVRKKFPDSFLNCWRKLEEELGLSVNPPSDLDKSRATA